MNISPVQSNFSVNTNFKGSTLARKYTSPYTHVERDTYESSQEIKANYERAMLKSPVLNFKNGFDTTTLKRDFPVELRTGRGYCVDGDTKILFRNGTKIDFHDKYINRRISRLDFGKTIVLNSDGEITRNAGSKFQHWNRNRKGDFYEEVELTKAGDNFFVLEKKNAKDEVTLLPNIQEIYRVSDFDFIEQGREYVVDKNAFFSIAGLDCRLADFNLDRLNDGASITVTRGQLDSIDEYCFNAHEDYTPMLNIRKDNGKILVSLPKDISSAIYCGTSAPTKSNLTILPLDSESVKDALDDEFDYTDPFAVRDTAVITDFSEIDVTKNITPSIDDSKEEVSVESLLSEIKRMQSTDTSEEEILFDTIMDTIGDSNTIKEPEIRVKQYSITHNGTPYSCEATYKDGELEEVDADAFANDGTRIAFAHRHYTKTFGLDRMPESFRAQIPLTLEDEAE